MTTHSHAQETGGGSEQLRRVTTSLGNGNLLTLFVWKGQAPPHLSETVSLFMGPLQELWRSHREHSVFPCMEADVVESGEWPLNVESKIWECVGSKDKKKINHSSGRRSCLNGKGRGDKEAE